MKTLKFNEHTLVVKYIQSYGIQSTHFEEWRISIACGNQIFSQLFQDEQIAQCEISRIDEAVTNE